ncbi:MAG: beta-lactamase family protein [Planctomycetaceae bacterium]|nr:beta-lactamase family protein [Planctomycetaceae bacterium]
MRTFYVSLIVLLFFVPVLSFSAEEFPVTKTLEPYVQSGDMAGFVTIIASHNTVLQVNAIGYKNLETKEPMTPDTIFWVASQSKPIAAVAVMILVDEGKLSLDEPFTTYLPEFKEIRVLQTKNEKQTVLVPPTKIPTLRQLLSHTSGMDWGAPLHRKFGFDILSYDEEATLFPTIPFIAEPGVKAHYSNMGINTAAMIVERISEKPYFEFLQERLFKPLGMKDTTFWPDLKRLATCYQWKSNEKKLAVKINERFSHPLDNPQRHPDAAAGLYSTAEDILKFYQMLLGKGMFQNQRILSEESVTEIIKKQTGNINSQYGLGMAILANGFGHGGTFGTNTIAKPAIDRILVYMTQEHALPKGTPAREAFTNLVK